MTPLDPDRTLALSYVPRERRPAVAALWHLDAALGAALAGGREPMIARIKLAWWRESLDRLDSAPPPPEPTLQALAEHVLPLAVGGSEMAAMEEGWAVLAGEDPLSPDELRSYAEGRGAILFELTARLLGSPSTEPLRRAGEAWALVDLARRSGRGDAERALAAARDRRDGGEPWPARLRPLGMLAVLAERDSAAAPPNLPAPGSPARMLRMLRHRLTGR